MKILPFDDSHLDEVVRLSIRAWAPVFASLEALLDDRVYAEFYPDGWEASQSEAVDGACRDPAMSLWVAMEDDRVAGFTALKTDRESRLGEIYMIAVDPDFQRRGIARALTEHAIEQLKDAGMTIVMVETGGDEGHAPARATYEATGFRQLPLARYFKKI
jgi:ribosomal protein S18 acetylase RimI-like enzyme